jgi:Flp pilus assembly protein CpaB
VLVAKAEIEKGTKLADLPAGTLTRKTLRGDSDVIASYMNETQFSEFANNGGVFVQNIGAGEAIPLAAVLDPENPAAAKYSALLLNDPNMTAMTIAVNNNVPTGIRAGDWLDLIVTVDQINPSSDVNQQNNAFSINTGNVVAGPNGQTVVMGGTVTPNQTPNAPVVPSYGQQPTAVPATATPLPYIVPIAKRIVNNAYVLNVIREQRNTTGIDGQNTIVYGNVTALVVVVPRSDIEWLSMANAAGKLNLALLSPVASDGKGATNGASVKDLIDKYYSDRATLQPAPSTTPTPGK